MYKWYLPTLSEIIQSAESTVIQATRNNRPSEQAEQQWYGAIAALNTLLTQCQSLDGPQNFEDNEFDHFEPDQHPNIAIKGLMISGPFPVLNRVDLGEHFSTWTLTGDPSLRMGSLQLPAAKGMTSAQRHANTASVPPSTGPILLLHPDDPLAVEPFCLVLTPKLSMVLTLGLDDNHTPQFFFSFDPDTIWQGWRSLRSRLQLTTPAILPRLECIADQFSPSAPDYQMVMEFSQLLLMQTPNANERRMGRHRSLRSPQKQQSPLTSLASIPSSRVAPVHENGGSSPAVDESQTHRYPSKPLNVNRIERLKLDALSWTEVAVSGKQGSKASGGSEPGKGNATGPRSHRAGAKTDHPHASSSIPKNEMHQAHIGSDVELLKAIAHEVRTPLTTIRTLTRLLMKRKDLVDVVLKRLEQIDQECTQQIDRFSLIFKAVELETTAANHGPNHLAQISLVNMFQQNVSRWKKQAQQRNLTLDVALPPTLPSVMSDPTVLDQVLTGLMDRMTHTLPPGTLIQLSVVPAGHQLKLQFWAKPQVDDASCQTPVGNPLLSVPLEASEQTKKTVAKTGHCMHSIFAPTLQAVGQLLMFQPETGNLSLNLDVTKNLFQSLGGKLIVRHTPTKGEVLTIFLPMCEKESYGLSSSLQGKYFC